MAGVPAATRIGAVLLTCLSAACGLTDVFAASGPRDVVFVWQGAPDLTIGTPVPLAVTVLVNGVPMSNPKLTVTLPDTTEIAFASTPDSIVGRSAGRGEVDIRLESSLATTPIDTVLSFQIHP